MLVLRGLSKSFGGARALDGVDLTVNAGEVHGLLGENGSGKSTLIKVLAGFHVPESGELELDGRPVRLPLPPGEFRKYGLSFVHQDLGLVPSLSVIDNLRVGELAQSKHRFKIPWRAERRRARETFARYGLDLDPRQPVQDLSPVEKALLAIVRAVESMREESGTDHGLLILDEPTVFLPKTATDQLFKLVREIAASGSSVLFVSHDLDEVLELTDRVTVLRDGHNAGTVVTAQTSERELVELIIGRRLEALSGEHQDLTAQAVDVAVAGLRGGTLDDVSIELHHGEVLGLTGLAGSGFEEVPYFLFGASEPDEGRLTLGGSEHDLRRMEPPLAIAYGMALIPADRQRDASIGSLSIADNVTMQVLSDFYKSGRLERGRMIKEAKVLGAEFDVRPNRPTLKYSSLSGGNQQKALLAKWLQTKPRLLLLHEPTQGVDVGARQQIFAMIRAAATDGMAVICSSSDYEQLATICDRVLIFARGRIVQQLTGGEISKERITEQCYNSQSVDESMHLDEAVTS